MYSCEDALKDLNSVLNLQKKKEAAEKEAAELAAVAEEKKKIEEAKKEKVENENKRLREVFAAIPADKMKCVDGLIDRAAFLRVELQRCEMDIQQNGTTEKFTQGTAEPYDRERPIVRQYNSYLTGYQKTIKQLIDLLPKNVDTSLVDTFKDFVGARG